MQRKKQTPGIKKMRYSRAHRSARLLDDIMNHAQEEEEAQRVQQEFLEYELRMRFPHVHPMQQEGSSPERNIYESITDFLPRSKER